MYSKNVIEHVKQNVKVDKIMAHYGFKIYNFGKCECPSNYFGKSHGTNTLSCACKTNGNDNVVKCFSCGGHWDSIDLWAYFNGLDTKTNFREIIEQLLNFEGSTSYLEEIKRENELGQKEYVSNGETKETYDNSWTIKNSGSIEFYKKDLNKRWTYLMNYLKERCIDYKKLKPILDYNNMELLINYYNYPKKINLSLNSALIVYKDYHFATKRIIDDYVKPKVFKKALEIINEKKKENPKFEFAFKTNIDHSEAVLIKGCCEHPNIKKTYIVEGVYDALTILCNGDATQVICLNSIENRRKMFTEKKWIDYIGNTKVIMGLDNDARGQEAKDDILVWLKENNKTDIGEFNFKLKDDDTKYKDINEWWIAYCKKYNIQWKHESDDSNK